MTYFLNLQIVLIMQEKYKLPVTQLITFCYQPEEKCSDLKSTTVINILSYLNINIVAILSVKHKVINTYS